VDEQNYKEQLKRFMLWFQMEMELVKDQSLEHEYKFLMTIAEADKVEIVKNEIKKEVEQFQIEIVENENNKKEVEVKVTEGLLENKASAESETDEIHGMKRKREEERNCVVCMEMEKKVLLLPCKHVCLCEGCSVNVDVCPLCRAMIKEKTTVFM